jgi:hypothetical protein
MLPHRKFLDQRLDDGATPDGSAGVLKNAPKDAVVVRNRIANLGRGAGHVNDERLQHRVRPMTTSHG